MKADLEYLITLHALHMLEPNEMPEAEHHLETDPEAYTKYVQHLETCAKLARSVVLGMPKDLMPAILERIRGVERVMEIF